ncbi:MAG: transporter substrate-binding domain-containing protein, partial [Gammaproteobacteria bacterium]|nr:transporter substrate-binding domain-containing protein [Gammaproteobacteria bacterium]
MEHCAAQVRVVLLILLTAWLPPLAATDLDFVTIEAAPWAYRDADGRPAGAFPEIIAELERRGGDRIAIALYPLARIDQSLEAGQRDCTIILWNDYRARYAARGEDVYAMPFGVIARKGVRLESYDDLAPLVISVTRGLAMHPRFDADASLRKDADKDYLTGLRKIAHGRVDAVAGALPTILHIARQAGLDD